MQNIEIKARYPDSEKAHTIAKKIGAQWLGEETQIDTYFIVPHGRFKLRESSKHGGQLVPYIRPNSEGPKKSTYQILPVSQPSEFKKLMTEILGVDVVVEKKRSVYILGNIRIHIDVVQGLGHFFEFEAVYENLEDETKEKQKVSDLLKVFEIHDTQLLKFSYRELLSNEKENR